MGGRPWEDAVQVPSSSLASISESKKGDKVLSFGDIDRLYVSERSGCKLFTSFSLTACFSSSKFPNSSI